MEIITSKAELISCIDKKKQEGFTVGLVPTMGALHQGHLSLIQASKSRVNMTVSSIFVNPTQFDNPDDLKKYPKPIEADIKLLEAAGCDILFHPSVEEMYTSNEQWEYEVGDLDNKLEGEFRAGHYKGVTQVVYKLFSIVKPDIAFFGQKDYQQFLVIKNMIAAFKLPIELVACDIVREKSGLAMSSRNIRLNDVQRQKALVLFKALSFIKENYSKLSLKELQSEAVSFFENDEEIKLEYLRICDKSTLDVLGNKSEDGAIVLVACYIGSTRLIDNMILS